MAAATATPTEVIASTDQKFIRIIGSVALSAAADTYTTGGMVMSLIHLSSAISSYPPAYCRVWSQPAVGSPLTNLYVYSFNPGTTQANGKLQIFTGAAAQTALTEYTSNAAITNPYADTLMFEALFVRL